jgi:hypothetical protein
MLFLAKKVFVKYKILVVKMNDYCNPNFGLATKARACKGAGQKGSLGVTPHAPGSAK